MRSCRLEVRLESLDRHLDRGIGVVALTDDPWTFDAVRFEALATETRARAKVERKPCPSEVVFALDSAVNGGRLQVDDPPTLARLLLGALTRGAMLVASSEDPEQTRRSVARTMRKLITSFAPDRD